MEKVSEKKIERKLCSDIEKLGGKALKLVSPEYTGVPDRVILIQGHVWWVETKSTGDKPRPRQLFVHKEFEGWGHPVWVIDNWLDYRLFIKAVKRAIYSA